MYNDLGRLLEDMHKLQEQLEEFFDLARERFRFSLEGGRVRFSREVQELQRRCRVSSLCYILDANLPSVLMAPVVYSMVVLLAVADLSFTLYQHICLRAFGVPRVTRSEYLFFDRHRLVYLNPIEKLNCVYCSYGAGVIAYAREIVSRTEQNWCPIRHARRVHGAHDRYPRFFDYGYADAYPSGIAGQRRSLQYERMDDV